MKPPKIRAAHGPEYKIQAEVTRFLRARGWHVERLVGGEVRGGAVQSGLPDLVIGHPRWGVRFVEIKNEASYEMTKAQKLKFPVLAKFGFGIWILTEATEEQYERLFKEPNWRYYWKAKYGPIDIDALLGELDDNI